MIWNWLSRRPLLVDVTLVGLLLFVAVVTAAHRGDGVTGIGLGVAETLPLLFRRQRPVLVLGVVTAVALVLVAAGDWILPFQLGLAFYTLASICERRVAVHRRRRRSFAAVVLALVSVGELQFGDSLSRLVFLIALWLLGDSIGSRRAYVREIEEKAERLERGREADARRAAAEEQARIARELHDVVAHALSVIVIQAAAADDVFEVDPARVREPIRAIETAARAALGDLRRVLGVLHEEASYDPLPGLGRLDSLVEQVRATGLAVSLEIQGAPRPLPAAVDLSAYRIVQEALTNTLKHASAEHASVRVAYGNELALEVRDDGSGTGDSVARRQRADRHARARGHARRQRRRPRCARGRLCGDGAHPVGGAVMTTRVLIADDQALVRSGFRLIVETRDDLEVVGEAENGEEAVRLVAELAPDVVLMDVRMPVLDGIEATRRIVASDSSARILVLTTFDLDEYVYAAIRAGASGFLLKDVRPSDLVDAIRLIAVGNALLGPTVTERLLERFADGAGKSEAVAAVAALTAREREILRLLAGGLSNAELAELLVLGETTVKTHVSSILRKLGVRDRVQAVIVAFDAGLVRPGRCVRVKRC